MISLPRIAPSSPAFAPSAAEAPVPASDGSEAILDAVLAAAAAGRGFTRRECDTLRCLLRGYDNRRIGDALGCGHKTVETHVTHLLAKSGAASRLELVCQAWLRWARSDAEPTWAPEATTGVEPVGGRHSGLMPAGRRVG
jgi:DNA-binding NarL/FixJ family response regulator